MNTIEERAKALIYHKVMNNKVYSRFQNNGAIPWYHWCIFFYSNNWLKRHKLPMVNKRKKKQICHFLRSAQMFNIIEEVIDMKLGEIDFSLDKYFGQFVDCKDIVNEYVSEYLRKAN